MSIGRHERARLAALERRIYALEHDHLAHRIEHLWDLFDELGMPLPETPDPADDGEGHPTPGETPCPPRPTTPH